VPNITSRRALKEIVSNIRQVIESFRDRLKSNAEVDYDTFDKEISAILDELRLTWIADLGEKGPDAVPPERHLTQLAESLNRAKNELVWHRFQQAVLELGGVLGKIAQIELDMRPSPNI